jgi:hypothetical protein
MFPKFCVHIMVPRGVLMKTGGGVLAPKFGVLNTRTGGGPGA